MHEESLDEYTRNYKFKTNFNNEKAKVIVAKDEPQSIRF